MLAIATLTRTNLGCEVKTEVDEINPNIVNIELSTPIALQLEPDPIKDKGINWETGQFRTLTGKKRKT